MDVRRLLMLMRLIDEAGVNVTHLLFTLTNEDKHLMRCHLKVQVKLRQSSHIKSPLLYNKTLLLKKK